MWELPNRGDRAGVGEPLLQLLPPRPGFLPMPPTLRRGAPGAPGSQAQGAALRGSPHKGGGFEGSKSAGGNQVRFLVFTDPGSEEPLLARVPPPCCVSSPTAEPDQGGGEHGLPEQVRGVQGEAPTFMCTRVCVCVHVHRCVHPREPRRGLPVLSPQGPCGKLWRTCSWRWRILCLTWSKFSQPSVHEN